MTQYLLTRTVDDHWIVQRSPDGRPPYEQVGRKWPDVRSAQAFYDTVSRPVEWVSPLRPASEAVLHGRLPIPAQDEAAHPASSGTSVRRLVSPG